MYCFYTVNEEEFSRQFVFHTRIPACGVSAMIDLFILAYEKIRAASSFPQVSTELSTSFHFFNHANTDDWKVHFERK